MSSLELLGFFSALLALAAFVGLEYGELAARSIVYDLLNFVAGIGLVVYALHIHGYPFVLTNSVWALVSGVDILRHLSGHPGRKRGWRGRAKAARVRQLKK